MKFSIETDKDGDLILPRNQPQADAKTGTNPELVLSEVHLECAKQCKSNQTTTFHIAGTDVDLLEIEHQLATTLDYVGLQVWRGSLLLADFLIQQRHGLRHGTVLELGAGPGVAGLIAAESFSKVFLTDASTPALLNCLSNVRRNNPRLASRGAGPNIAVRHLDWLDPPEWVTPHGPASACLTCPAGAADPAHAAGFAQPPGAEGRRAAAQTSAGAAQSGLQPNLDDPSRPVVRPLSAHEAGEAFSAAAPALALAPPNSSCAWENCQPPEGSFAWSAPDLADLLDLDLVLAADCIYDNDLTEALMRAAAGLLRFARRPKASAPGHRNPKLLVSLEKRVAFTLRDLDVRAPAYDYWRTLFVDVTDTPALATSSAGAVPGTTDWHDSVNAGTAPVSVTNNGGSADVAPSAVGSTMLANTQLSEDEHSGEGTPVSPQGGMHSTPQAALAAGSPTQGGPQGKALDGGRGGSRAGMVWRGRQLEVGSVPQVVREYERSEYLELWELWLED